MKKTTLVSAALTLALGLVGAAGTAPASAIPNDGSNTCDALIAKLYGDWSAARARVDQFLSMASQADSYYNLSGNAMYRDLRDDFQAEAWVWMTLTDSIDRRIDMVTSGCA